VSRRSWASLSNFSEGLYFRIWRFLFGRSFAYLGTGTRMVYPDIVKREAQISIGDDVYIGRKSWLQVLDDDPNGILKVGSGTYIGRHIHVVSHTNVTVEANVLIADNVYLADNTHDYQDTSVPIMKAGVRSLAPVTIGEGAWLGENVCVVGASVGQHSVIGANSTVIHDIPGFAVAAGSPAKVIKLFNSESGEWELVK
jgi:acetyltransferase-like isoleucine patch superfamily enzyme